MQTYYYLIGNDKGIPFLPNSNGIIMGPNIGEVLKIIGDKIEDNKYIANKVKSGELSLTIKLEKFSAGLNNILELDGFTSKGGDQWKPKT